MKTLLAIALPVLCFFPHARAQNQPTRPTPSFDCAKASTRSERLICGDSQLSVLDGEYALLYKQARQVAVDPAEFKTNGLEALKWREANCKDKACLVEWFAERKRALTVGKVTLARTSASIRKVDFRNFTYRPNICAGNLAKEGLHDPIQLRDGKSHSTRYFYDIGNVLFGDFTGDGVEDAAVHILCGLQDGNWSLDEIHFFALEAGNAREFASINRNDFERDYARQFPGGSLWYDTRVGAASGNLRVSVPAEGPHCCPEYEVTLQYR